MSKFFAKYRIKVFFLYQAYYAKEQGLTSLTTETGAGQWGTALSEACAYFGLPLDIFMVKVSYEQKPFRKAVMQVFDGNVIPSPSTTTQVGKKILGKYRRHTVISQTARVISRRNKSAAQRVHRWYAGLQIRAWQRAQSSVAAPVRDRTREQEGNGDTGRISRRRSRLRGRRFQSRRTYIAPFIACADSGAGKIVSHFANFTAASKTFVCSYDTASI